MKDEERQELAFLVESWSSLRSDTKVAISAIVRTTIDCNRGRECDESFTKNSTEIK